MIKETLAYTQLRHGSPLVKCYVMCIMLKPGFEENGGGFWKDVIWSIPVENHATKIKELNLDYNIFPFKSVLVVQWCAKNVSVLNHIKVQASNKMWCHSHKVSYTIHCYASLPFY